MIMSIEIINFLKAEKQEQEKIWREAISNWREAKDLYFESPNSVCVKLYFEKVQESRIKLNYLDKLISELSE